MANTKQAKKRVRQALKRRTLNVGQRSMLRTFIKKVVVAIESGDKTTAQTAYNDAVPIIDRMASKGIIHKNKAARHKGRLYHRIEAIA